METGTSIIPSPNSNIEKTKLTIDNYILKCSCSYWCVRCDYKVIRSQNIISHICSNRHRNNCKASAQNLQREPTQREDGQGCLKCKTQFNATNKHDRYLNTTLPKRKPRDKNHCCQFCEYKTNEFYKLDHHMRTHTGEKPYKCSQCDFETARPNSLQYHINEKHDHAKYPCKDCSFTAKSYSQLRIHKDTHHTDGFKYVCELCGYKTKYSGSYSRHKRIHEGRNLFKCDECKFQGYDSNGLINHKRTHSGVKPFKCEQCNVSFAEKGNLKTHRQAIHENKKEFACTWEDCNYRANLKANLSQHIAIHSDERPFSCTYCPHKAKTRINLKHHERKHLKKLSKQLELKIIRRNRELRCNSFKNL